MFQIGCLHISVSVSENATTITVNTYFPGAAPAKLFNLTDRPVLYWQNTEVSPAKIIVITCFSPAVYQVNLYVLLFTFHLLIV